MSNLLKARPVPTPVVLASSLQQLLWGIRNSEIRSRTVAGPLSLLRLTPTRCPGSHDRRVLNDPRGGQIIVVDFREKGFYHAII